MVYSCVIQWLLHFPPASWLASMSHQGIWTVPCNLQVRSRWTETHPTRNVDKGVAKMLLLSITTPALLSKAYSTTYSYIYIYIYHYTSTPSIRGLCARSQFWWGRKPECPEETLEVKLRSTETQSTYNICSRGGRRDRCSQCQPDFPSWLPKRSCPHLLVFSLNRNEDKFWKKPEPS